MKSNKLLEILKGYLGIERRAQIAKYDSIKNVLKKLKKKENTLKDKLKKEPAGEAREQLEKEMEVLSAQRKKGMAMLKEIKEEKKK
jgi:hypothetical protein